VDEATVGGRRETASLMNSNEIIQLGTYFLRGVLNGKYYFN